MNWSTLLNYVQAYFVGYQPFIIGGTQPSVPVNNPAPPVNPPVGGTINLGVNIGPPVISHIGDPTEQQLVAAHNLQRAALKRTPLLLHECLTRMALFQVQYMYQNGLTHEDVKSPDYYDVSDRAKKMQCHLPSFGENAAVGQLDVNTVMQDWMNSPGHKRNILDPNWRVCGFAREGNYWCAVFGG